MFLTACSGTAAPAGSAASTEAADAPKFSFSQESLHAGVLSHDEMIKAARRTLQFPDSSDFSEQSWLSVPDYELSNNCNAARNTAKQMHPASAFGGYVVARDSTGRGYGTGFFDLGDNATVREAIAKAGAFFGECAGELRGEVKIAVSKSSTSGGFGLRAHGNLLGEDDAVLYQTIAGYGNVFLYAFGPDQATADRVAGAERRHLDELAPVQ